MEPVQNRGSTDQNFDWCIVVRVPPLPVQPVQNLHVRNLAVRVPPLTMQPIQNLDLWVVIAVRVLPLPT